LLKTSIEIESKLSGPTDPKIGRRYAELSVNLAAQNKWNEGVPFVKGLLPMVDQYAPSEKQFIKGILLKYSENQSQAGNNKIADEFKESATRF